MNKKDIIAAVAEDTKYSMKDVKVIYDALMQAMADAISDGEKVRLQGIGVIETVTKQPRIYYNPKTQEKGKTSMKRKLHFIPSKTFNDWLSDNR